MSCALVFAHRARRRPPRIRRERAAPPRGAGAWTRLPSDARTRRRGEGALGRWAGAWTRSPSHAWRRGARLRDARGQASIALLGVILGVLAAALVLGAVARAVGADGRAQGAADLAALAGGRAMLAAYPRLFEPAYVDGRPNPAHLDRVEYLALARAAAEKTARANGLRDVRVSFPDAGSIAPVRIAVEVSAPLLVDLGERGSETFTVDARAEAQLAPGAGEPLASGGGYDGPLAYRQGKPMRPDVAQAFDRLEAAAREDGVTLLITSAYRSDAEQALLFARHPDPRWVARPGQSLHRNATELDLGPPAAYAWLAANAERFGFIQRYSWEPWHYEDHLRRIHFPTSAVCGHLRADSGMDLAL